MKHEIGRLFEANWNLEGVQWRRHEGKDWAHLAHGHSTLLDANLL